MRPLILLSNDDGIDAAGLAVLAEALGALGDVLVVAPERERSAISHAITLHKPLRPRQVRDGWYSLSGTPVDCVYAGILRLAPRRPDLVVSGINDGFNLGSDVFYSGTVAAAVEAALRDVPAIALSQAPGGNFAQSAQFGVALAASVLAGGMPRQCLLSVNFPREHGPQFRFTRLGERAYRDQVEEREDLQGRTYYWIGGPSLDVDDVPDSDGETIKRGFVSVTPLRLDLTAHDLLDSTPRWSVEGYHRVP
jgi:5'-nucleotidase